MGVTLKDLLYATFPIFYGLLSASQGIAAAAEKSRISTLQPYAEYKTAAPSRSTYESLTEERGTFASIAEAAKLEEAKAKAADRATTTQKKDTAAAQEEGAVINFNNVSITEVIKYVSRLTGRNFVYDPAELQFEVTIQSEEPATVEDVMVMLLQNLRIHGFSLIEEGPNFLIHLNSKIRSASKLFKGSPVTAKEPQIVSYVFTLQNIPAEKCAAVVKGMLSDDASIEVVEDTKLIVTDLASNIERLIEIIHQLDTKTAGYEIGQYVALNTSPAALIGTVERLMQPLAAEKAFIMVPHSASNSVFIVSTPFLVEKALSVMQMIDLKESKSGLLSDIRFDPKEAERARKEAALKSQAVGETPDVSKQRINAMDDAAVRDLLKSRGYTETSINLLSGKDAKQILWQELNSPEEQAARGADKRRELYQSDLPIGETEATQFYIQKLQYRKSSDVAQMLKSIAGSISSGSAGGTKGAAPDFMQTDLLITLNSIQPLDDNNTLVFTGNKSSLAKVKELITQIDVPVRQVLIETLVLDTTLEKSLQFGVEWGGKIQRTNFGAQIGFDRTENSLFGPAFNAIGQFTPAQIAAPAVGAGGMNISSIGRKIKYRGRGFRSTGALIHALSIDQETHIILNPKISTEHNVPAEIFVGEQVPIKGQSIVNATGVGATNIVSTNYETRETGILLKVTPLISADETVTLIIEQRISSANAAQVAAQGAQNAPPATTKETRTLTRVHLPSDHFFIMSGLISEEKDLDWERLPCLGAIPLAGSLFGVKEGTGKKRNLLIFIRPIILDTPVDIDTITKRQEEILKAKSKTENGWRKEVADMREIINMPTNIKFTPD